MSILYAGYNCCSFMIDTFLEKILLLSLILGSIVVSIPACHAGDRGSIPRRGDLVFFSNLWADRKVLQLPAIKPIKKS